MAVCYKLAYIFFSDLNRKICNNDSLLHTNSDFLSMAGKNKFLFTTCFKNRELLFFRKNNPD